MTIHYNNRFIRSKTAKLRMCSWRALYLESYNSLQNDKTLSNWVLFSFSETLEMIALEQNFGKKMKFARDMVYKK